MKRLIPVAESWIYYFEKKSSSHNVKQCSRALDILASASSSACLPVHKALSKLWLFLHRWRQISDTLSKDLECHKARMEARKAKAAEGEIAETEVVSCCPTTSN